MVLVFGGGGEDSGGGCRSTHLIRIIEIRTEGWEADDSSQDTLIITEQQEGNTADTCNASSQGRAPDISHDHLVGCSPRLGCIVGREGCELAR